MRTSPLRRYAVTTTITRVKKEETWPRYNRSCCLKPPDPEHSRYNPYTTQHRPPACSTSPKRAFSFPEIRTPAPRGRPRADPRAVLNAILWVEQNGEHWKHLPAIFPSQQTCYAKFMIWRSDGTLQKVKQALSEKTDSSTSISDPAMSPS
ncbi:transposase [Paraburkholderia phytofirmans]|uniref:transposase n=1 Tax=Paraburkholderia phytofirmans TaxID=261302 RepID=UPI003B589CCD